MDICPFPFIHNRREKFWYVGEDVDGLPNQDNSNNCDRSEKLLQGPLFVVRLLEYVKNMMFAFFSYIFNCFFLILDFLGSYFDTEERYFDS